MHLVHAVASAPSELQVALTEDIIENLVNEHREALEKLAEARRATASLGPPTVEVGDPRDTIVGTAQKLGIDLIVRIATRIVADEDHLILISDRGPAQLTYGFSLISPLLSILKTYESGHSPLDPVIHPPVLA